MEKIIYLFFYIVLPFIEIGVGYHVAITAENDKVLFAGLMVLACGVGILLLNIMRIAEDKHKRSNRK